MRTTFVLLGHTSMVLGIVGIFVPLWPTTPFVLLAAVCYSRGSERFNSWLHQHPRFGPMLHSWREHRAISRRAKVAAVITVVASLTYSVVRLDLPWNAVALLVGAAVLVFILTRKTAVTSTKD